MSESPTLINPPIGKQTLPKSSFAMKRRKKLNMEISVSPEDELSPHWSSQSTDSLVKKLQLHQNDWLLALHPNGNVPTPKFADSFDLVYLLLSFVLQVDVYVVIAILHNDFRHPFGILVQD
jgi:CHASE1-domain containing sensor protein